MAETPRTRVLTKVAIVIVSQALFEAKVEQADLAPRCRRRLVEHSASVLGAVFRLPLTSFWQNNRRQRRRGTGQEADVLRRSANAQLKRRPRSVNALTAFCVSRLLVRQPECAEGELKTRTTYKN